MRPAAGGGPLFRASAPGEGDARAAVAYLCRLFARAGLKPVFDYIPASQLELFGRFSLSFDARFSDCVLPAQQLLRLSWKYKHKTADYNYFTRTVPGALTHPFSEKNLSPLQGSA